MGTCAVVVSSLVAGSATQRSIAARASDVIDVLAFGALGTNSTTTIGTTYGSTLADIANYTMNGVSPYAWALNPNYGLMFTMVTSVAQGSAGTLLTFLKTIASSGSYTASVAMWQDPEQGNLLVRAGMLVSGTGITAGTIVSSVQRDPLNTNYGTFTLSAASTSAIASGTAITFTIAPAQVQALTTDWLGIQSAIAYANATASNGAAAVYFPPGRIYWTSRGLVNANANYQGIRLYGGGQVNATLDFGADASMIGEANRTQSGSSYFDLIFRGPNATPALNTVPNQMFGMSVGSSVLIRGINSQLFKAGVAWWGDHNVIQDSNLTNNYWGLYWGPYSYSFGNQDVSNVAMVGNTRASVGVSSTNQIDASQFIGGHTGASPFGFVSEANPPTVTNPKSFITNTAFMSVPCEAVGNQWLSGPNVYDSVIGNTFIGGNTMDVGTASAFMLSGVVVAVALVGAYFAQHTMTGTPWNARSFAFTTGMVQAVSSYQNWFINDLTILQSENASKSVFYGENQVSNIFVTSSGSGKFVNVNVSSSSMIPAGVPIADQGNFIIGVYTTGSSVFGGVLNVAATGGTNVPLITSSPLLSITKAPSAVGTEIDPGNLLIPATGGFVKASNGQAAPVIAGPGGDPGNATMSAELREGLVNIF